MLKSSYKNNNNTRMSYDPCYIKKQVGNYEKSTNYMLPDYWDEDNSRQDYLNSVNESVGTYIDYNKCGLNKKTDSDFKNGKYGNISTITKCRNVNNIYYTGPPYSAANNTFAYDPKIESELEQGILVKDSCSLRGQSINRFVPLVPHLKENIQNPKHYIPKYWVRGGMSTRPVIQNIDYLKKCGCKK